MEKIILAGTYDTPEIYLSKEENRFEFSGKSLPEDVNAFYGKILNWVQEYVAAPNPKTIVDFRLTYFNTSSSKILLDIMMKLEEIPDTGNEIIIRWHYLEYDEDMLLAGKEYAEMVEIPFEFVPYHS
ncbi:MAG: DUF1987 domain-containing protein [Bacteroidales bacterium]